MYTALPRDYVTWTVLDDATEPRGPARRLTVRRVRYLAALARKRAAARGKRG